MTSKILGTFTNLLLMEKYKQLAKGLNIEPKNEETFGSFLQTPENVFRFYRTLRYRVRKNKQKHTSAKYRGMLEAFLPRTQRKNGAKKSNDYHNNRLKLVFKKLCLDVYLHGTIMRIGIICNKIFCYMLDLACRWLIVEKVKIFRSYVKERNCKILIGLCK